MDITQFIAFLNKKKGWNIQGSYYAHIARWKQYWQGYVPDFHTFNETGLDGAKHKREMYRMRMPKRVCEDWAGLLLNERTTVTIQDRTSAVWLLGEDQQQTGGLLADLRFWPNANALVELTMRSGTGAFVMGVEDLQVADNMIKISPGARLYLDYLPAECILPITVRHGKVIDVAFASEVFTGGKSCVYLQTHQLISGKGTKQYRITNEYFVSDEEQSDGAHYKATTLPAGMLPYIDTGSAVPWFSLFSPAAVKNLDGGAGLGMAVFAEAIDQAKQCDVAFNNYHRDIYLGGKKVFYNKKLIQSWIDSEGNERHVAPDDIQQQLFYQSGDTDSLNGDKQDVYEYNPDLRVDANGKAVQDALDYFSFKCGLGTHHYQFDGGNISTATQYTGDRQDMVQHANKHHTCIEAAVQSILRSLLWAGKAVLGQPVDPDTAVTINWDDSYIIDAGTRRQQDMRDALEGFIPKYRYNMEWRGMNRDEAMRAVQEAASEMASPDTIMGFGGDG